MRVAALEKNLMEAIPPRNLDFSVGDTLTVKIRVREGEKDRFQNFEGVVIAIRRHQHYRGSFTVRNMKHRTERVFPNFSPMIEDIKVTRKGDVRRAKLYYLRNLRGKAARIREKVD